MVSWLLVQVVEQLVWQLVISREQVVEEPSCQQAFLEFELVLI